MLVISRLSNRQSAGILVHNIHTRRHNRTTRIQMTRLLIEYINSLTTKSNTALYDSEKRTESVQNENDRNLFSVNLHSIVA